MGVDRSCAWLVAVKYFCGRVTRFEVLDLAQHGAVARGQSEAYVSHPLAGDLESSSYATPRKNALEISAAQIGHLRAAASDMRVVYGLASCFLRVGQRCGKKRHGPTALAQPSERRLLLRKPPPRQPKASVVKAQDYGRNVAEHLSRILSARSFATRPVAGVSARRCGPADRQPCRSPLARACVALPGPAGWARGP